MSKHIRVLVILVRNILFEGFRERNGMCAPKWQGKDVTSHIISVRGNLYQRVLTHEDIVVLAPSTVSFYTLFALHVCTYIGEVRYLFGRYLKVTSSLGRLAFPSR